MRRLFFWGCLVLGALIGLIWVAEEGWATRAVMMGVGVLFAAPVAWALSSIGKRRDSASRGTPRRRKRFLTEDGTSAGDLEGNFWRDQGHPPFAKPMEFSQERKDFDPLQPW